MEEKKEEIEIYSLMESLAGYLKTYKSSQGVSFSNINIRAIVIHQIDEEKTIEEIVSDLVGKGLNPYHYIIDKDGKIYQLNNVQTCVQHCRSKKYTAKANTYFGDNICPSFEENENASHPEACADNCTLSILLPAGKMNSNVYNAAVKLNAYLINKYTRGLQATANVLGAYEISEAFDEPKCFKEDPDTFLKFKYDIEKLRSQWLLHYGGFKRGYCTEHVYDVKLK